MKAKFILMLALLALLALAAACGTVEAGVEPAASAGATGVALASPMPTDTAQPTTTPTDEPAATNTDEPTAAPVIPTVTPIIPTVTPIRPTQPPPAPVVPTKTPTTAPSPTLAMFSTVKIYMIAINDGGQAGPTVGCGDSAVAVNRQITPTNAPLKSALTELLSIHTQYYGQSGLYDALYQSNLKVDSVVIQNGVAKIALSGQLVQGGECDSPRIKAQLEYTAKQFATVQSTDITINGTKLDDLLSLKGN